MTLEPDAKVPEASLRQLLPDLEKVKKHSAQAASYRLAPFVLRPNARCRYTAAGPDVVRCLLFAGSAASGGGRGARRSAWPMRSWRRSCTRT